MDDYTDILNTVIDNGRVEANDSGGFDKASLEAEIRFEAEERGADPDAAVAFAMAHTI